jgi:hypothetical protein
MLAEFADPAGRQDGFLHRLLFVAPKARPVAGWSEVEVDEEVAAAWKDTLLALHGLEMVDGADFRPAPRVVRMAADAKRRWVEWYDGHAAEMRSPVFPARLIGPWRKLEAYAARLTAVLHGLWEVPGELPPEGTPEANWNARAATEVKFDTVERAIQLIDYLKDHTRRVYARMRDCPEDQRIQEIVDWVRRRGGRCTPRDLLRSHKAADADAAKKLLREVEARGFGRVESRRAANGKLLETLVLDGG